MISLLQISCWVYWWKNFENLSIFGKDMHNSWVSCFFWTTMYIKWAKFKSWCTDWIRFIYGVETFGPFCTLSYMYVIVCIWWVYMKWRVTIVIFWCFWYNALRMGILSMRSFAGNYHPPLMNTKVRGRRTRTISAFWCTALARCLVHWHFSGLID